MGTLAGPFKFYDGCGTSGSLAFTGPATARLLIVTSHAHDVVHVIHLLGEKQVVGLVAEPGVIPGPRGVAVRGSLVAISAWKGWYTGDHAVHVYQGSGASWTPLRVLAGGFGAPGAADGQLGCPNGLRFTADGAEVVVADLANNRLCLFRVEDGSFVRHVIAPGLRHPSDVEECVGGWLVVCRGSPKSIEFVSVEEGLPAVLDRARLTIGGGGFSKPVNIVAMPGLGLAVRDGGDGGRVLFLATKDIIAMEIMSPHRLEWMAAVFRGVLRRAAT
jgi:hypothetical protein